MRNGYGVLLLETGVQVVIWQGVQDPETRMGVPGREPGSGTSVLLCRCGMIRGSREGFMGYR